LKRLDTKGIAPLFMCQDDARPEFSTKAEQEGERLAPGATAPGRDDEGYVSGSSSPQANVIE